MTNLAKIPALGLLALALQPAVVMPLQAQYLRRGVVEAEAIVIGRNVGFQPLGTELQAYTIEVLESLRGPLKVGTRFSIAVRRRVSDQQRPAPVQVRMFCLRKDEAEDRLPSSRGPWYQLLGYPGDHPKVSAPFEKDPLVRLARVLLDAESGEAPAKIAQRLMSFVFTDHVASRYEAVLLLSERDIVRGELNELERSEIASRAIGETDDVEYKIAMASLAARFEPQNFVPNLCLGLDQVEDLSFSRALGRIARLIHGESSTEVLLRERARARGQAVQDRILVAVGATGTKAALDALMEMHTRSPSRAVEVALQTHGAPQARQAVRDAVAKRKSGR